MTGGSQSRGHQRRERLIAGNRLESVSVENMAGFPTKNRIIITQEKFIWNRICQIYILRNPGNFFPVGANFLAFFKMG